MPATFITGYDGSDAAKAALSFTRRLAAESDARVVAAQVYPRQDFVYGKGMALGAVRELEEESRKRAAAKLEEIEAADVERAVVAGPSAAEGLHRFAEDRDAGLVAVGVTHRGGVGKLVLGSVAEHLLHGAPCPVAVVPSDWTDAPIANVAVAYDRRDESRGALDAGERLARSLGARLTIIAVHEPILAPYMAPGVPGTPHDLDLSARADFEREMRRIADGMADLDVEVRVVSGAPGRTIVDLAEHGIDVLLMGSRGYGAVRSVLLGSVSRYVVDHAPCPVIVVPAGVSAEEILPVRRARHHAAS